MMVLKPMSKDLSLHFLFLGGLSTSLEGWFIFWIFEMYCVIFGWLIITIMFSNPEYAVQIGCMVKSKHI